METLEKNEKTNVWSGPVTPKNAPRTTPKKILRLEIKITEKIGSRFVEVDVEHQYLILTDKNSAPFGVWEWAEIQADAITLYWEEIGVEKMTETRQVNELFWIGKRAREIYELKVVDISE